MAQLRLFVGYFLYSTELTASYQRLYAEGAPLCSAKWVAPEQLHCTLKFLGEVHAELLPPLTEALTPWLGDVACPIRLTGLGTFPSPQAPRVLYIGVEDPTEGLRVLHQRIQEHLQPLGFPLEERPFKPHVTLARIRSVRHPDSFRHYLRTHRGELFAEFEGFRLVLVHSQLTPQGPLYSVLAPAE